MDNIVDEYNLYWETKMFLHNEDLHHRWGLEEALSGHDNSDGGASSPVSSKNVASERNRRKKLNDGLLALRAAVPNISKLDKASTVKDAIKYIQELQAEERRIQSEITEMESSGATNSDENSGLNNDQKRRYNKAFSLSSNALLGSKKKRTMASTSTGQLDYHLCGTSPVEDIELRISEVGETAMAVSVSCSKRSGEIVRLCEVFESLEINIISANITSFAGKLSKTLLLQVGEEEKKTLKMKIESAIATLNDPPPSPSSSPITI